VTARAAATPRRLADAYLRGDHHHVDERVDIEPGITVAPERVGYQGNRSSGRPQLLDRSDGPVVATQPGLHPRRQPVGLDLDAARAQPVGETAIEDVGIDPPTLVLDQKRSGRAVVPQQLEDQSRGRPEEFAELLERAQHAGGDHTAEVHHHCAARHRRGINRAANAVNGGHAAATSTSIFPISWNHG